MAVMTAVLQRHTEHHSPPTEIIAVLPTATTVMSEARAIAAATMSLGRHVVLDHDQNPLLRRAATNGELDWLDSLERQETSGSSPHRGQHDDEPGVVLLGDPEQPAWDRAIDRGSLANGSYEGVSTTTFTCAATRRPTPIEPAGTWPAEPSPLRSGRAACVPQAQSAPSRQWPSGASLSMPWPASAVEQSLRRGLPS